MEDLKISAMPRTTALAGAELVPLVKDGKNMAATTDTLVKYAQIGMMSITALQEALKTYATNDDLSDKVAAINRRLDTLMSGSASNAIDTFNEIEAFLAGITDTQSLTGMLADLRTEILGEVPTKEEVVEKQDKLTPSEDINIGSDNTIGLTQDAKLRLFNQQWNAAWGTYGKYDPANAPDPQHPYYGNEIWMTYDEAMNVMSQRQTWGTSGMDFLWNSCRTNVPIFGSSARYYSNSFTGMVVANLIKLYPLSFSASLNGKDLSKILNLNATYITGVDNSFNAPKLEVLQISNLKISLDLSKCPLINLESWQGLVSTAINATAITITVHPDVYAKLIDENNTEWNKVLVDGAAKNITFASI